MKKAYLVILNIVLLTTLGLTPLQLSASIEGDINAQLDIIGDVYGQTGSVGEVSLAETIAEIIKVVLTLLGILLVALIIYAGFVWMTSAGNEERITRAKKTIVAAIIGAAIVILAYAITVFVVSNLVDVTNG